MSGRSPRSSAAGSPRAEDLLEAALQETRTSHDPADPDRLRVRDALVGSFGPRVGLPKLDASFSTASTNGPTGRPRSGPLSTGQSTRSRSRGFGSISTTPPVEPRRRPRLAGPRPPGDPAGHFDEAGRWLEACLRRRPEDTAVWRARLEWAVPRPAATTSSRPSPHLPGRSGSRPNDLRAWFAARLGDTEGGDAGARGSAEGRTGPRRTLSRLAEIEQAAGRPTRPSDTGGAGGGQPRPAKRIES